MQKQADFLTVLYQDQKETHIIFCPNCEEERPYQQLEGFKCFSCTICRFSVFLETHGKTT